MKCSKQRPCKSLKNYPELMIPYRQPTAQQGTTQVFSTETVTFVF